MKKTKHKSFKRSKIYKRIKAIRTNKRKNDPWNSMCRHHYHQCYGYFIWFFFSLMMIIIIVIIVRVQKKE